MLTTGSCGMGFHGRSLSVERIVCSSGELLAGKGELVAVGVCGGGGFRAALEGGSEDGLALREARG